MLEGLGLSGEQEAVYRALVGSGAQLPDALAAPLGLGEDTVRAALDDLARRGLVTARPEDAWVAAPPGIALAPLLIANEEALHRARLELDRLAEDYRRSGAGHGLGDVVDLAHGREAVAQRFAQLQAGA